MMTCDLDLVMRANLAGVAEMVTGDYPAAVKAFRSALTDVKALISFRNKYQEKFPSLDAGESLQIQAIQTQFSEQAQRCYSYYDRCFIVPSWDNSGTFSLSSNDYQFLVAILMYNYAMAVQHTQGSLRQVTNLYKITNTIVEKLPMTEQIRGFALAVSNNLAAVSLDSFSFSEFENYRNTAHWLLVSSPDLNLLEDFCPSFFAGNFAASVSIQRRPAAAA